MTIFQVPNLSDMSDISDVFVTTLQAAQNVSGSLKVCMLEPSAVQLFGLSDAMEGWSESFKPA